MMKINPNDAKAMDQLFTAELKKAGLKTAAEEAAGQTEVAFEDHESYLKTLEDVLKEDKSESWDPNDLVLD